MLWYLCKRAGMAAVIVVLVMTFLSLAVHLVPGEPARIILGQHATPELIAVVREEMGLDKPVPAQVWDFVSGAVRGDFGTDFTSRLPVADLVLEALPHTVFLALASIVLAVAVGVPLGIAAARHPNTLLDRALGGLSILFLSAFPFVVGLALLLVFAVHLGWLPALGAGKFSDPVGYAEHLILPAVAIAVTWVGYISRLLRAGMLEVLAAPYIRTARAYGFRDRVVFYKYALKNALVPLVGFFGLMVGYTLAGTVAVEVIFSRPGLGSLVIEAINDRNWPIVRAVVLVYALFFILANLFADLSYRLLDPRIRIEDDTAVPV